MLKRKNTSNYCIMDQLADLLKAKHEVETVRNINLSENYSEHDKHWH